MVLLKNKRRICMFTKKDVVIMATAVGSSMMVSGCQWSICKTEIIQPTVGKELIDLHDARNSDAINENEFNRKKIEFLKEKRGFRGSGASFK